jgi:hypothetical protein
MPDAETLPNSRWYPVRSIPRSRPSAPHSAWFSFVIGTYTGVNVAAGHAVPPSVPIMGRLQEVHQLCGDRDLAGGLPDLLALMAGIHRPAPLHPALLRPLAGEPDATLPAVDDRNVELNLAPFHR